MAENKTGKNIKNFLHSLVINLSTMAITIPVLIICLVLTFAIAFGAASMVGDNFSDRLFRRIVQGVSLVGCLGSLIVDGVAIYYVNKFLEKRFKKQEQN